MSTSRTSPAAPVGPGPFMRWLTVVGTLVIAGAFLTGLVVKRQTVLDTSVADPLAAFDAMIRREPIDDPLPASIARDAERSLRALLDDAKQPSAVARGARARLAVVLGERGRWAEAQPLLVSGEAGAAFSELVACAYGPDRKACGALATCDEARAVAMAAYAGAWCARRACILAARRTADAVATTHLQVTEQRTGDTTAAPGLQEVPVRFPRLRALRTGLDWGILLGGLVAAAVVWTRRHRPRPPPVALAAPWSFGDLYAALIRCLLWSLLVSLPVVGLLTIARVPVDDSVGVVLYVAGLWWTVRIVFRRWGLSWRDSLRWRAGQEVGLTLLAAVGVSRGGGMCVGLAAAALRRRTPWTDLLQPVDPMSHWRLAASLLSTALLPPLLEELVFRRALLTCLGRRFAPSAAILLSTLLFTLPHGYSPIGLLTVFWSGLVFAWAFNRTGNLWPSVAAHAYGNGMALWWSLM